ncbi:MAG: response regulator [Cyanobacteria bacterium SID2]|nr:response regulator [Cyanobacteria bacterium SID2]MBP0003018.1 response regulator [Cyanobacteria bacterium SBC]
MSDIQGATNHRLFELLAKIYQHRKTGKLSLSGEDRHFYLYFESGRLAYAIDPLHRRRRWYRAIDRYCREHRDALIPAHESELWEYECLQHGIFEGTLTVAQVRDVLYASAREVFFSLQNGMELSYRWQDVEVRQAMFSLPLSLSALELKQLWHETRHLNQQWQALGLNLGLVHRAPRLARSIDANTTAFSNWMGALNGQYTFWDLVVRMESSPSAVTRLLHHFHRQSVVQFLEVGDRVFPRKASHALPTIACLDDSKPLCDRLGHIVMQEGYRFEGFQDPIRAIPQLIEQQPNLLFLDLVMPIANGYEVCTQLRRVSALQSMPIVILTSNNGIFDRLRARMVGASDFLAKPISSSGVLSKVWKYLSERETVSDMASPQFSFA